MRLKFVLTTTMSAAAMAVMTPKTQWDAVFTMEQAQRGGAI